ncbi:MAG: carboxypeptidase-like regulatory domain-containing protein, partial [Thaumarchaeota archaeon]|nr:carboxypeptidase-like regulatory domain-containing protein [Nitrososphaerota archaeon]
SFELTIASPPPPATFVATVSDSPSQGGTTDPAPGDLRLQANELLTVTAIPSTGWSLSEWLVDGSPAGNGTRLSFFPVGNATIEAIFSQIVSGVGNMASVSFTAAGPDAPNVLIDGEPHGLPTSVSWAVGSNHNVSAPSIIQSNSNTELVLVGWHGAVNSSSPTIFFTVEKDATLVAEYQARYLTDFAFVDSSGAPTAAQNATIYGPEGLMTIASSNYSAWLQAGATYIPLDATVGGVVVPVLPGAGNFTASYPGTVTVALSVYPISVRVVDMFGQPISGANVTLATSGHERFTQTTGKNGLATFNDVPMGWFTATYTYLGVSGSLSSSATGAHNATVTMALSYPIVSVAVIFVGVTAISLVRRWRRNGQVSHSFDGEFA